MKHVLTVTLQSKFINSLKNQLKENEIHVIVDFPHNYECKYDREVHGAHFHASKKAVSLHTDGFYYKRGDQLKFQSFAALSENVQYDASAV